MKDDPITVETSTTTTTTIRGRGVVVLISVVEPGDHGRITVAATARGARLAARIEAMVAAWPVAPVGSRGVARDYFYWWHKHRGPSAADVLRVFDTPARRSRSPRAAQGATP